jgi:folate-dependent phosphoribosylglycinamide formyltransferase PurN
MYLLNDVIFRSPKKRGRVAVFLSGRGSNFMSIREAVGRGDINAEISLVFSNKEDAPGFLKAKEWGLETLLFKPTTCFFGFLTTCCPNRCLKFRCSFNASINSVFFQFAKCDAFTHIVHPSNVLEFRHS